MAAFRAKSDQMPTVAVALKLLFCAPKIRRRPIITKGWEGPDFGTLNLISCAAIISHPYLEKFYTAGRMGSGQIFGWIVRIELTEVNIAG